MAEFRGVEERQHCWYPGLPTEDLGRGEGQEVRQVGEGGQDVQGVGGLSSERYTIAFFDAVSLSPRAVRQSALGFDFTLGRC